MITRITHVPGAAPMHSADTVRIEYTNGRKVSEYPASLSHAVVLARNSIVRQVGPREWEMPQ